MKEIKIGDKVIYKVYPASLRKGKVIAITENFLEIKTWWFSEFVEKNHVEVITDSI